MITSAAEKNGKDAPRVLHYWDGPFATFAFGVDDFTLELTDGTVSGWQRFHGTDVSHRGVVAEREGDPVKFRTWKAKPTATQWKEFRHALDKTAVWRWEKEYFTDEIKDGACWRLEIALPM